eukprot:Awhi_evm1s12976
MTCLTRKNVASCNLASKKKTYLLTSLFLASLFVYLYQFKITDLQHKVLGQQSVSQSPLTIPTFSKILFAKKQKQVFTKEEEEQQQQQQQIKKLQQLRQQLQLRLQQQQPRQQPQDPQEEERQNLTSGLRQECDKLCSKVNLRNVDTISDKNCERIKIACGITNCRATIDIVIPWVNGTDPNLQSKIMKEKMGNNTKYQDDKGQTAGRFRDFNQLKYLLRSIEQFGNAFARRIFIVANDQWPDYILPVEQTLRLRYIDHKQLFDYKFGEGEGKKRFPDQQGWYSFNSIAIQYLFPWIPTLSEAYLSFDDDFLLFKTTPLSALYDVNKHKAAFPIWKFWGPIVDSEHYKIDLLDDNQYMKTNEDQPDGYETTVGWWDRGHDVGRKYNSALIHCIKRSQNMCYIPQHGPLVLFKSLMKNIWKDNERDFYHTVSKHKFRQEFDGEVRWMSTLVGGNEYYKLVKYTTVDFDGLKKSTVQDVLGRISRNMKSADNLYFGCYNDELGDTLSIDEASAITKYYEYSYPKKATFEK